MAVFDADWPASHMSNRVVVTAELPDDVAADDVLAFTEDVFAGRGLTHRKVDVLDDALGRRLGPGLAAAGYEAVTGPPHGRHHDRQPYSPVSSSSRP